MNFSKRLKELRLERKLTQEQLGSKIELDSGIVLSQQRITHWETGTHQPDIETFCRLADFFEVSVDYLIGHSDIRTPLKEIESYKLNKSEQKVISLMRQSSPEFTDTLTKLLSIVNKHRD